MSKATIVFTDSEGGQVDVKVDFGEGTDDSSGAHHMAMQAMTLLVQAQQSPQDDYED
jgi:hypothetical protein